MAVFRKIHTSIWGDSFFSELDQEKKLFYLYLLTNERTKQCGIYEITKKQIAFDLGYDIDRVCVLLGYFISEEKIKYNSTTNEIAVGNWLKYNWSTSPKVQTCMNKEFSLVKDRVLIEYVHSNHTASQEEKEEEEEEEEKKNNFSPPSSSEIEIFGKKQGYKLDGKKISAKYLKKGVWVDSHNKPVKDWKERVTNVWCTDDKKLPTEADLSHLEGYLNLKQLVIDGKMSLELANDHKKDLIRKGHRKS